MDAHQKAALAAQQAALQTQALYREQISGSSFSSIGTTTIATSIATAHLSASRAERVLHELIGDLTGANTTEQATNKPPHVAGTCENAHDLSCRIEAIANMVEKVQELVTGSKNVMVSGGGGGGGGSGSFAGIGLAGRQIG